MFSSIFQLSSEALANSLAIALVSTALACILGLLAASALHALFACSPTRPFAHSLLALSVLPLLLPSYIVVSFWMEALGAHGWLARVIAGGHAVPLNGLPPTIAVLSLIYWSPVALACSFTLSRIDRAMVEAAELSLGKIRARFRVVAPLLWPSVAASGALVFVLTFSNFSVPAIYQVKTIQNEIYVQFNANFDVGNAFLFAVPQLIAAGLVLVFCIVLLKNRPWISVAARPSGDRYTVSNTPVRCPDRFIRRACSSRTLGALYLTVLILLSSAGPLLRAIGAAAQGRILWQTLVVSATQIRNSFWFSFIAATIVTGLAVLAVNGGASAARRQAPWLKGFGRSRRGSRSHLGIRYSALDVLLLVPFVLPEILVGIALIALFNRPSLQFVYTSMAIVLVALVARYFIVGKLAVSVGRSHLDPSLFEAAELAGLPWRTMMFRVELPLLGRWLFVGWWLTYLFCLADIGSLVLIYPPGSDTVPIRIFNLLHYGYDAQVSALCLVMLVLGAAPALFWTRMRRRSPLHD